MKTEMFTDPRSYARSLHLLTLAVTDPASPLPRRRAPRLQRLVKEAAMRGTRLLLMPEGMARSVSNTTAIISNKKQHAVGGGGRGRGRSKRNSTSGRGGRGHVGAVPGRGSRDTLSASGKGHEASSGEQGGVVHASDISGCSRGVAGSQVDQVIMATNDEDIMAPREPKQAVAVLAGPLKISHDVVVKQKPVDADEQAKEGARSVVQTSSASEAVVCRSEASVPADRAPRTASNADSSGRAAICTTGEACPAGGPLILGGSSILEGNQAQQGPPEANDSRVIAPPSRLLLQIGNPQSDGRRKWEGDKGGGAQGATNSSIAWRVEWLFSGVTSAGDGVGEGLMVADDAVPEGRSLHEVRVRLFFVDCFSFFGGLTLFRLTFNSSLSFVDHLNLVSDPEDLCFGVSCWRRIFPFVFSCA